MLTREAFLAKSLEKPAIHSLPIPEMGGEVFVRVLTSREKDNFEILCEGGKENIRARVAVMCLCDGNGAPLFTEDDAQQLGDIPAPIMDKVFRKACKVNGFTGDVEEELKN